MTSEEKVNILLVDDQPSKLLTYEVILRELGDNLIKASSGKEALEQLLKNEIAVVLMDVCMPELDGFELASMIRGHPRFQKIAMIFISAIYLAEIDHLRGYEMGAVDYVPVPVIPQVLRAKVRVFTDLFRKSRQLERLNAELEDRVVRRTAELEASTTRLLESEHRRSLALSAGQMGSWDWDLQAGKFEWDEGQHSIYGLIPGQFAVTPENLKVLILPEDWEQLQVGLKRTLQHGEPHQAEFRVRRPNGEFAGAQQPRPQRAISPATYLASVASQSTLPTASRPKNARRFWRRRSIIAPKMRWQSSSRSSGSPKPSTSRTTLPSSKGGSKHSQEPMRSCRTPAGREPI